jgi:hypothetical protein
MGRLREEQGRAVLDLLNGAAIRRRTDDQTVHPGLSLAVARLLRHATLHVSPHGDHLTLFDAEPALVQVAERFIDERSRG